METHHLRNVAERNLAQVERILRGFSGGRGRARAGEDRADLGRHGLAKAPSTVLEMSGPRKRIVPREPNPTER